MSRVLVTGMSGVGKSTLLQGLARRGHAVVDTDDDGWVLADGRWDELRMHELLAHADEVVVSGTVENQGEFYGYFDHVVLLSAPLHVLLERVTARSSNPYGNHADDRAEISGYVETVEPLLRRGATLELDGRADPSSLVAAIELLLSSSRGNEARTRSPVSEQLGSFGPSSAAIRRSALGPPPVGVDSVTVHGEGIGSPPSR